jgi:uncharacterized protein YndB with AHSA1/START domain
MLTVSRRIAAPPAAVWELLTDLDAWPFPYGRHRI